MSWVAQFGSFKDDFVAGMVLTQQGDVLATVQIVDQHQTWLSRYAVSGQRLWTRHLWSGLSYVRGSASDGAEGLYVGAQTKTNLGGPRIGGQDVILSRCDPRGAVLWMRKFGSLHDDFAAAACEDGVGGVYFAGSTLGSVAGPNLGSYDVWLKRFDPFGTQLWVKQFGSASADLCNAIAPDGSGGVFLCGRTDGALGGPLTGPGDSWLGRFDSAGNKLWLRQPGVPFDDGFRALISDGNAGVACAGYVSNCSLECGLSHDVRLVKLDASGNQMWSRIHGTGGYDDVMCAATDGAGGYYLAGYSGGDWGTGALGYFDVWISQLDPIGNIIKTRQLGTSAWDYALVAVPDGLGGLHLGGQTTGNWAASNAGEIDAWLGHAE